jgi:hypothetical protein
VRQVGLGGRLALLVFAAALVAAVLPHGGKAAGLGLTLAAEGAGTVTGAGLCTASSPDAGAVFCTTRGLTDSVTVTATPATGWRFDHWSGVCQGSSTSCTVTMDADHSVVGTFVALPPPPPASCDTRPNHGLPAASLDSLSNPGFGSADATGTVDPNGSDTVAMFAWTSPSINGWAQNGYWEIPASAGSTQLTRHLENMAAGDRVNVWVQASNACGTTQSSSASITTYTAITVGVDPVGTGTVSIPEIGASCRDACIYYVPPLLGLTFDAVADSGWTYAFMLVNNDRSFPYPFHGSAPQIDSFWALMAPNGGGGGGGGGTTYSLSVAKSGSGAGSVSSSPPGIDCGSSCTSSFAKGSTVTLHATAVAGSSFAGWSGACAAETKPDCTFTLTGDASAGATFVLDAPKKASLFLGKSGSGSGTVSSSPAGIDCGSTCSAAFAISSTVTLHATAALGSSFAGWTDACAAEGTAPDCTVTLAGDMTVGALFNVERAATAKLSIAKSGSGTGSVSSSPSGIDCGASCAASFATSSRVTLHAAAAEGSSFEGWSGACAATGTSPDCTFTLEADASVGAAFAIDRASPPPSVRPAPACRVPRLLGLTLARARQILASSHCRLGKVSYAYASTARPGLVVSQSPKAGMTEPAQTRVNAVLSKRRR